jgi:squalene-hopene/tetraprenyl-beta-curcumene cyclase
MSGSRRWFLRSALTGAGAWLVGGGSGGTALTDPPSRGESIDTALSMAAAFLRKQQAEDGAWRSDHYGPFKEGDALTPLVLRTLLAVQDADAACRKGADYLAAFVKADGSIEAGRQGLSYPLYTSAGAIEVLSHPSQDRHRKARDGWLAYLRRRQLTEELGWQPADKPYGGWGYCPTRPRKPKPGEPLAPLTESNLSATVFALDALAAAGIQADDPAFRKALVFVRRCQNFADDPKQREEAFDDGGFFFIYDDPVRNKAGAAGKDRSGRERYYSYGSTTADGWRALLHCGRPADDPRVRAARAWMEQQFRADVHPGKYAAPREGNRGAVYYYYCCSVAQTLRRAGVTELAAPKGKVRWAEVLAEELIAKQRSDGSWVNLSVPQREDDPLVATSLAALALAHCRRALAGE